MKKIILCIGAIGFMLTANPLYAQKTTKKETKTEKEQKSKNRVLNTSPAKKEIKVLAPVSQTQIAVKPKLVEYKPFDSAELVRQARRLQLRTIEASHGMPKLVPDDYSTMTVSPTTKKGDEFCTTTTLNTSLTTEDFSDFSTSGPPEWIKPGVILDVPTFIDGSGFMVEKYARGPITIATNAPSATNVKTVVRNPQNKSEIIEGIQYLLSKSKGKYGANFNYSYSEIRSKDELNYKVNGRYSNSFAGVSVKLGMTSNSKQEYHYYLVEFKQTLFGLEVDAMAPETIFPNDPEVGFSDYVYVSQVNYGRKGYFMLKTNKSMKDFGASASVSASYLGNNASVQSNINKISSDESTEVLAFYYGGTSQSASNDLLADWEAKGRKPLSDYIEGHDFSAVEAYPVSYKLKNLNNKPVGMNSTNKQDIETCVPIEQNMKLKITLFELQCDTGDGGGKGDFGITQHVRYKANGEWKTPINTNYKKIPNRTNCYPGDQNSKWAESTPFICGNIDNQIYVDERKVPKNRDPNIINSVVYEISATEANDKQAVFEIDTWVKEYTSTNYGVTTSRNDIVMNKDSRIRQVAIHDVLASLKGLRTLKDTKADGGSEFEDGGVDQTVYFDHFDGASLPLRNIGNNVLEGPIRARNRGTSLDRKAFIWMRFELIE